MIKAISKRLSRDPIAKVRITWTDPLIDLSIEATPNDNNRVSYPQLVANEIVDTPYKWFHLNNPDVTLDGTWHAAPGNELRARRYHMGWWGETSANESGNFVVDPMIQVNFAPRLVIGFTVAGDNAIGEYPVDFTATAYREVDGSYVMAGLVSVTGNDQVIYSAEFGEPYNNISRIELEIHTWSAPGNVVKIAECYSSIVREYSDSDIVDMSILEEVEGTEATLPVGNISCNEMDLQLQNIDDRYFPGNTSSDLYTFIKRNRKIEPFVGFRDAGGTEYYEPKGLYWSGEWEMSQNGTTAATSGRDRMELFRTEDLPETVFSDEQSYVSIYDLMDTLLDSAIDYMPDLYYVIDDSLSTRYVPNVLPEMFEGLNYFDAIKKIIQAGLAYAYMDTPTAAEIEDGGPIVKDVLRVITYESAFPDSAIPGDLEELTAYDYITKTQPATESTANIISVGYTVYSYNSEEAEWESSEYTATVEDEDSKKQYGKLKYEYTGNELIQTEALALEIANRLLASYKEHRRKLQLNAYGDPTHYLTEKIILPDYVKGAVNNRVVGVWNRINLQYNGSLRIDYEATIIPGAIVADPYIIDEDGTPEYIIDEDGTQDKNIDEDILL